MEKPKKPSATQTAAPKRRRGRQEFHAGHGHGVTLETVATESGRSIDELSLVDYARAAAEALRRAHPQVVFTSGRRDSQAQASAMAGNVVQRRRWIADTYTDTAESRALQQWVDNHPTATTQAAIAAGLAGVMANWTDAQKSRLSRHFGGQAFDVQPVGGQAGEAIKATIKSLPRRRRFLQSEGGLTIWHVDFE